MKKGRLFYLFVILVLFSEAYAQEELQTSSSFPDIILDFTEGVQQDERVYIINATLSKGSKFYDLNVIYPVQQSLSEVITNGIRELESGNDSLYPNIPSTKYILRPSNALSNGNYTFSITVSDLVGNNATKTIQIIVSAPYMNFWPDDPPLFVSPQKIFDFSIRTQYNAECKFSPYYYADTELGYNNALFYFNSSGTSHVAINFNNISYMGREIISTPQTEVPLHIYCRRTSGDEAGKIDYSMFNLSYDLTPPVISASADPKIIVEKVDGRVKTKINVNSDDKVVCRHSWFIKKNGSDTEFIPDTQNFAEMVRFVSNETDPYAYIKNPSKEIDVTSFISDIKKNYTFTTTVACMNRATFKGNMNNDYTRQISNFVNVTFLVSLLSPVQITVNSPQPFTSSTDINLNLTTSKTASCLYTFKDRSEALTTTDGKSHMANLGTLGEGNYSIKIDCTAPEGTGSIDYKFVIDLSNPSPPSISTEAATCTNSISATFTASDEQSGIAGYNWTLRGATEIAKGTVSGATATITVDKDSEGRSLNLSQGIIYTFSAIAQNRAGLWSTEGVSNGTVYDNTGILCDKNPPLVLIKQNSTPSGTIVSLVCIDKETKCDNSTYQYFVSSDRKCDGVFSPLPFNEMYGDFATSIFQSGYFCFKAKDIAGNEVNGSEAVKILTEDFCSNGVKDAGETGVDCGGQNNCPRCGLDTACSSDIDCSSGYCDLSTLTCKSPSCTDTIKNGYETDIDCGGSSCSKCDLGKKCKVFSDCESNYCNNESICAEATCTDNIANGNETDIDCGGNCNKCENGKECLTDSDCISGKCSRISGKGVCVMPLNETLAALQEKREIPILKIIFLIIGFISTFGGSGYLSYKKYKLKKKPVSPTIETKPISQKPVSVIRRVSPMEQIRKAILQQKLRKEEAEKEKEREKIFEAFGKPVKEELRIEKPMVEEKKELEKPVEKPKKEEKSEFERLEEISKKESEFEKLEKLNPTEKGKKIIEELIRKKKR